MIIIVVEEHHEVYIPWLAVELSSGPIRGAALLHVDAHADFDLPVSCPERQAPAGPEAVIRATCEGLDVQTFISVAVWQGVFDQVVWLRPGAGVRHGGLTWLWRDPLAPERLCLGRKPPEGVEKRGFDYHWRSLENTLGIKAGSQVILDIDLDFWASGRRPSPGRVEITEDEYRGYKADCRHYLRRHFGARVRALEDQGRYYFTFQALDVMHRQGLRRVSNREAAEQIARLGRRLAEDGITPALVTLCRSRLSGYCPQEQWEFLERECLAMLADLYGPVEVSHIDQLTARLTKG